MHHIAVYNATALGINASETDLSAATDPSFSQRNSHLIFTEPYELLGSISLEANLTDVRIGSPTINSVAPARLHPINRSLTPPATLKVCDLTPYPMMLPTNEEITIAHSNNLGAATEAGSTGILFAPTSYQQNIPRGIRRQLIRTSQSVTLVANAWSADTALTFTDASPRGGWYYLVGSFCQVTNGQFFRINFPRATCINNRKLFPGYACQAALDDFHYLNLETKLGTWGLFHTFEPPLVAVFGTAAGAQTAVLLLDSVYVGDTQPAAPTG